MLLKLSPAKGSEIKDLAFIQVMEFMEALDEVVKTLWCMGGKWDDEDEFYHALETWADLSNAKNLR